MPKRGALALPFPPTDASASNARNPHTLRNRMRVIDLFSGAGGLSIGFANAGVDIVAGAEWDPDCCETFAKAHPGVHVLEGDVSAMDFTRWRDEVDLVIGGPPCQPWSTGGKRLGAGDDRDGWPAFLAALDQVQPVAFVAENVAGFTAGKTRPRFEALVRELEERQFAVSAKVLNAADFGAPQNRQRVFIVGSRKGGFTFPRPSRGPNRRWPWRAAGELVNETPFGEPNPSIVTYARTPDLRPSPYDGQLFNGGGRPIDLKSPAPTLLASMGGNKTPWIDTLGIVPEYHEHLMAGGKPRSGLVPGARRITVEEAAMLQTFPSGVQLAGTRSSRYRQVGNAVPPLLAEKLAWAILRHLEN